MTEHGEVELDAFAVAAKVAAALDGAGVPYAIGGALAYGLWGDPRGTYDVDINLFVDHGALAAALDVIERAGVSVDRAAAVAADAEGDVIVGWYQRLRVDLFTPSIPFSWEAMRTRVSVEGPRGRAFYLSAEAIAIFKLLFFRSKDLADVERLVVIQGPKLDRAYVRRWMVDMMGEGDGRVLAWDRVVADRPPIEGGGGGGK